MIWLTADQHFYHKNIIKYENRPFVNVEDMNNEIIHNYNTCVKKDDTCFMLGDFSLSNKEETKRIANSLKGRKILIMGNHDRSRSRQWLLDCGFHNVIEYPIIIEQWYILSHEPIEYVNENMPFVNIFGHVHGDKRYATFSKSGCCVSLERHQYFPISIDNIREEFKKLRGI